MKKRTSIAIIAAIMMLTTMMPSAIFADSSQIDINKIESAIKNKKIRNWKEIRTVPKTQLTGAIDEIKAMAIEFYEMDYQETIKSKSNYITEIWQEINKAYEDGRAAIIKAKTYEDLLEAYFEHSYYLEVLGELTKAKVKRGSDLAKLKTEYRQKIDKKYKSFKKINYNSYYRDMIENTRYVGVRDVKKATTFKNAALSYSAAMITFNEEVLSKIEIKYLKQDVIDAMTRYTYIGLDPKGYDKATWAKIKGVYSQAVSKIKRVSSERAIMQIFDSKAQQLIAITSVEFVLGSFEEGAYYEEYYYPYVALLLEKLEDKYYSYDRGQYSSSAYRQLDYVFYGAWSDIDLATTRSGADKIYSNAIKAMNRVPTKKEEIAKLKAKKPAKLKTVSKKHNAVKLKWSKVSNAKGYVVYRSTKRNGHYKKVKTTKNHYTAKKLASGKTYYFKVRAYNNKINSGKIYYSKYSKKIKVKLPKK